MNKFLSCIKKALKKKDIKRDNHCSIIGSWRLWQYTDSQNNVVKAHWKEVLSFAAMDEAEINGVYVFDYMNLHSIVGKWMLDSNLLKLQSKEYDNSYIIIDLTADRLALKPTCDSQYKTIEFDRVI